MAPLLIPLAMQLGQFVPGILKLLTGSDKVEEIAGKVVDVARVVTGIDDPKFAVEAIQADPSKMMEFQLAMGAQQADFERMYLADMQDARKRDVALAQAGGKNRRADIMLALTYLGIVALVSAMFLRDIDANTALGGMVILLIGKLIGQWETGFAFEFGTTRANKTKDDTINRLSGP